MTNAGHDFIVIDKKKARRIVDKYCDGDDFKILFNVVQGV